jgi:O-antigen ligase
MAIVLFCAWRLTRSLAFDDIVECYLLGLFGVCAAAIAVAIAAPDIGVLKTWQHAGQWNGIFVTKQTLGIGGALLLFFSSYRLLDASRRPWHYAAAAVALVCVIASGSRGGGALAVVSVVCVYLTRLSTRFARGLAFAPFVMILLGIALIAYFVATGNKYLVLFDAELDFTERSFIWQHALRFYPSAPWLGHGPSRT